MKRGGVKCSNKTKINSVMAASCVTRDSNQSKAEVIFDFCFHLIVFFKSDLSQRTFLPPKALACKNLSADVFGRLPTVRLRIGWYYTTSWQAGRLGQERRLLPGGREPEPVLGARDTPSSKMGERAPWEPAP